MVLGVRLQLLGELPDASIRKRDLDLGGTRVLISASVLRDQLAFDFRSCCQTAEEYTSGAILTVRTQICPRRRIAGPPPRASRSDHRSRSRARARTSDVSTAS